MNTLSDKVNSTSTLRMETTATGTTGITGTSGMIMTRGLSHNIIFGGSTMVETSRNSQKAYAREYLQVVRGHPKITKIWVTISFDEDDLEGIKFPHDDPLVIIPVIGNSSVKRVLIDGGASVDILLHEAFSKMECNDSQLTPSDMPFYSFNGVEIEVEGIIQLPMNMGQDL